jgi:hypothetical protein
MNIMDKCIICSAEQDLNTSMEFKVDDEDYKVFLCPEHADDTTPKAAREALEVKVKAYNDLKEKAEEMGFQFEQNPQGLLLPEPIQTPMQTAPSKKKYVCACGKKCNSKSGVSLHQKNCVVYKERKEEDPDSDHFEIIEDKPMLPVQAQIDVEVQPQSKPVQLKRQGGMAVNENRAKTVGRVSGVSGVATGASGHSQQIESHDSYDLNEMLKDTVTSNLDDNSPNPGRITPNQTVEETQNIQDTRTGSMMALPKKIESELGTTIIEIVDTGGDRALQERTKETNAEMAGLMGEQLKGYNQYKSSRTITCPLCRGVGLTRAGKKTCPKCGGVGILS